jgi:hypothetical protein
VAKTHDRRDLIRYPDYDDNSQAEHDHTYGLGQCPVCWPADYSEYWARHRTGTEQLSRKTPGMSSSREVYPA